jgi:phosphatidylglycerophosphate synthase
MPIPHDRRFGAGMVKTINASYSKGFLRRYHFSMLITVIPHSISPLSITLFGLVSCLSIPVMIVMGARRDSLLFSLSCAVATYFYTVADHLDGMQARRVGSGTYRGTILDHICDFINGCFIILGAFWASGMSIFTLAVLTTFYILAFSITHLEVVLRRELRLGALGPLEALLATLVFFATMSVGATRVIWEANAASQWPIYWLLIAFFLYWFLSIIWSTAGRIWSLIDSRYIVFAGLVVLLGFDQLAVAAAPDAALAVWAATVACAAGYVLELLVADPGEIPTPALLPPLAITIAAFLYSGLYLQLGVLIWSSLCIAMAIAANLVMSCWQLPRHKMAET